MVRDRRADAGRAAAVLVVALVLLATSAHATEHYIRAGAAGTETGEDWTNAYTGLPADLLRGDTYYVAVGSYDGWTIDDTLSNSLFITVKRATYNDHGAAPDWHPSYGEGQATISSLRVYEGHVTIDGQVGGGPGSWTGGHGFRFYNGTISDPVVVGQSTGGPASVDNITLKHFESEGWGDDGNPVGDNDCIAAYQNVDGLHVSHAYAHSCGRTVFFARSNNTVVEYSYFGEFESASSEHAESFAVGNPSSLAVSNWVYRYNVMTHGEGTGGFIFNGDGLQIYGNVFVRLPGSVWVGNGAIATWSWGQMTDAEIYNNSFIEISKAIGTGLEDSSNMDGDFSNNIFYGTSDVRRSPYGFGNMTHSHNHYVDTTGPPELQKSTSTGDPFSGFSELDFELVAATVAGDTLPSPFDVDMNGHLRGQDGVWDRGALELNPDNVPPVLSDFWPRTEQQCGP